MLVFQRFETTNAALVIGHPLSYFGDMTVVQIPVDESLLASAGVDAARASEEFRLLAAAKLFELRRISLGQAAGLAALSRWDFIDALRRLGVSWSNLTDEQIEHDIDQA